MSADTWRGSKAWPPKGVGRIRLFLAGGGRLLDTPAPEASRDTFIYDPNDPSPTVGGMNLSLARMRKAAGPAAGPSDQRRRVESRKDHVAYSTDALRKDVAVAGAPQVKLYVSSDRKDTDFVLRLCDVHPDGRSMLVTDGAHRMRFRRSVEREEFMTPGRVYEVTVALSVTAHTFRKGHRIRALVSSSNYPRFDVNPNNGESFLTDSRKALRATNTIHTGAGRASAVMLPVMGE